MKIPANSHLEFIVDHAKPQAKVSVILLDWSVRESFHSLHYLNQQSVDRSQYELIWIEFYDRKPQALLDAVQAGETAGRPLVDKLVVMNYPRDVIFHKHRMYNLGIVLAEGNICVICDSDAMFTPNFIQSIITAFEQNPQSAVHLDEVRSVSRGFYPFNFPTFEEFLATPCPNWTGRTTKGLDRSSDMLHEANYGACLAARREDLIRIGGSDEHLDYLGYICGPYDLTFRLANAGCRERWLTDEYLYHSWHPGESGMNIDYHGPSDGRGMSSRSLSARKSGEVRPGLENGAIRALRLAQEANQPLDRGAALAQLTSPDDDEWRNDSRLASEFETPQLVAKALQIAFDVYSYRGCWYAIPTCDELFDPEKAMTGGYSPCLRGHSREELDRWIRRHLRFAGIRRIWNATRQASRNLVKEALHSIGITFDLPYDPVGLEPQLVCGGYEKHNIIHYRGQFYGVAWSQGAFEPSWADSEQECPCFRGASPGELKIKIQERTAMTRRNARLRRRLTVLRPAAHRARRLATSLAARRRLAVALQLPLWLFCALVVPVIERLKGRRGYDPELRLPQIVLEGFQGHNIIFYQGMFYGAHQSLGPFNPALLNPKSARTELGGLVLNRAEPECPYWRGRSSQEVEAQISEWVKSLPRHTWNWRHVPILRAAARIIRPFIPSPLLNALRRRSSWQSQFDDETAIARFIGPNEIQAERKVA